MDRDKIKDALDEINDIVCSCRNGKNGYISEIDLTEYLPLFSKNDPVSLGSGMNCSFV